MRETVASQPATLAAVGTAAIQIQLVGGEGYAWPTEVRDIDQRYSDAPPARLRTLTAPAFAAAKLSAWMDRHAPPSDWVFDEAPDESAWRRALSHQTRLRITAQDALQSARVAWARASE